MTGPMDDLQVSIPAPGRVRVEHTSSVHVEFPQALAPMAAEVIRDMADGYEDLADDIDVAAGRVADD